MQPPGCRKSALVFEVTDNALKRTTAARLSVKRVGGYEQWLEWLRLPIDSRRGCDDGGLEALCDGGNDGGKRQLSETGHSYTIVVPRTLLD